MGHQLAFYGSLNSARPLPTVPTHVAVPLLPATPLRRPQALHICVGLRFGARLRDLRLNSKLTQCEMARKFGIDRSYISDVERGRKSISLNLLEVIALGLNVSLSELFRGI